MKKYFVALSLAVEMFRSALNVLRHPEMYTELYNYLHVEGAQNNE